jgi:predicted membrane protein
MTLHKKYIWILAGIITGSIAGYAYWHFVGCTSGTCAITSVWYRSTLYGSIMGGLLASTFFSTKKENV